MKKEIQFLLIAPSGNGSEIYKSHWLKDREERMFDVCLLHYHKDIDEIDRSENVDYFYHLQDYKYPMIHRLLTEINTELLNRYDYFFLIDDDIEICTQDINQAFLTTAALDLELAQPSLTHDSYCSWPFLKSKRGSFIRFVGEVEVMAPIFSKQALNKCLSTFIENKSSWGMDTLWSYLLDFPKDKIAVFDFIKMKHINPVGHGELYLKLKNKHREEWEAIQTKYGLQRHYFREYGRVENINSNSHRFIFFRVKLGESLDYLLQAFRDLGLQARIKSQLKKITGKNN